MRSALSAINMDYRSLFMSVPDLYLVLSPKLRIMDATDAYLRATLMKREEILGEDVFNVFHHQMNVPLETGIQELKDSLNRVLERGIPDILNLKRCRERELKWKKPGFEDKYWSIINYPMFGPDHELLYIIHRIEEEPTEQLYQAIRARDEFLSICSHELRTPITSLKLQIQMAWRDLEKQQLAALTPEKHRRFLSTVNRQVDRLLKLIEDMLEVGRVAVNQFTMHLEKIDLGELVTEVVEHFSDFLRIDNAHIQLNVHPNIIVECDRYRMEQVIINLITNGFKYGGGEPVKVTLTSKDDRAILTIEDRGMGIASENHERIFQPFERATSAENISGMGLGLYLVREILDAHGGRIRVDSELGRGSSFIVEIPLKQAAPEKIFKAG